MPLAASIEFPRADVDALFRQIDRAQKEVGMKLLPSLQRAGVYVGRSLKAATKESKKLRPLVQNPDPSFKTDHRKAPWGVNKYRNGKPYFAPIYRTGEYGQVRFFDKRSSSWFDRSGGPGKWRRIPETDAIGNKAKYHIKDDPRRIIGRKGLAKKAWGWAMASMYKGGIAQIFDVPNVAGIQIHRDRDNPGVTITNNLKYATDAFRSPGAVEGAIGNAARKLEYNLTQQIAKRMGAK